MGYPGQLMALEKYTLTAIRKCVYSKKALLSQANTVFPFPCENTIKGICIPRKPENIPRSILYITMQAIMETKKG